MKKLTLLLLGTLLVMTSCNTYTGAGAYGGAAIGGVIGSAIGGLSGGPRGSDVGTLIGLAGGAAVGAAVGSAADESVAERRQAYRQRRATSGTATNVASTADADDDDAATAGSGFDETNSGDDRIDLIPADSATTAGYVVFTPAMLTLRNVRFVDSDGDGQLAAGETATLTFDIVNNTDTDIYDVAPWVTTQADIVVTQSLNIDIVPAGKGIRYTAMLRGGDNLSPGQAALTVGATTADSGSQPAPATVVVTTIK